MRSLSLMVRCLSRSTVEEINIELDRKLRAMEEHVRSLEAERATAWAQPKSTSPSQSGHGKASTPKSHKRSSIALSPDLPDKEAVENGGELAEPADMQQGSIMVVSGIPVTEPPRIETQTQATPQTPPQMAPEASLSTPEQVNAESKEKLARADMVDRTMKGTHVPKRILY